NAYYGEPFVCEVRVELLADRFLVRPVALRKRFIDYCYALRLLRVLQREVAAFHQRNLQSLKIIRGYDGDLRLHRFIRTQDVPLRLYARRTATESQRNAGREGHRLNPRQCFELG